MLPQDESFNLPVPSRPPPRPALTGGLPLPGVAYEYKFPSAEHALYSTISFHHCRTEMARLNVAFVQSLKLRSSRELD